MDIKECKTQQQCGGCIYLEKEYDEQLKNKTKMVQELISRYVDKSIKVKYTIGMENPYNYRNKGKFAFGLNKNNKPVMGFFQAGTHKIIPFEGCIIQNDIINEVAKFADELSMIKIADLNFFSMYRHSLLKGEKVKKIRDSIRHH